MRCLAKSSYKRKLGTPDALRIGVTTKILLRGKSNANQEEVDVEQRLCATYHQDQQAVGQCCESESPHQESRDREGPDCQADLLGICCHGSHGPAGFLACRSKQSANENRIQAALS